MKVENMKSNSSGRPVANQFFIEHEGIKYFQSYNSVIVKKGCGLGGCPCITLDENTWDYSTTTGRYRNQFLGEGIAETRKKIESGEYKLANLNG